MSVANITTLAFAFERSSTASLPRLPTSLVSFTPPSQPTNCDGLRERRSILAEDKLDYLEITRRCSSCSSKACASPLKLALIRRVRRFGEEEIRFFPRLPLTCHSSFVPRDSRDLSSMSRTLSLLQAGLLPQNSMSSCSRSRSLHSRSPSPSLLPLQSVSPPLPCSSRLK